MNQLILILCDCKFYFPVRNQVEAMNLSHEDIGRDHVELDKPEEWKHDLKTQAVTYCRLLSKHLLHWLPCVVRMLLAPHEGCLRLYFSVLKRTTASPEIY